MGQDQERMGPSKERSAGQRTFLSLMLIGDVLLATAACVCLVLR